MPKYSRTLGPTKTNEPGGRVQRYHGAYVGFVKDNKDVQKMGRLRVWIPEFGSRPDDEQGWFTVSYASPFAGATNPDLLGNNIRVDDQSQTSYGWWAVPPDLENQVLIIFVNADPTRGVWLGCLYQQYMNHMVPGVAATDRNYQHDDQKLPVVEYNKRTKEKIRDDILRPESTTQSTGISAQGLINDNIRGITDASARRESPSQVYGLFTPGPIDPDKDGKRLGGTSFYFDDGEDQEHVRVRTRTGAQLLIDETNGIIYAINKLGTSWIQMDKDGNVDIFGARSFSVRSQEDINFRADRDINLEAGQNVYVKAAMDYTGSSDGSIGEEGSGSGGTVLIQALNTFQANAGTNAYISADGELHATAGGNLYIEASMEPNSGVGIKAQNARLSFGGYLEVEGDIIAEEMYADDFVTGTWSLDNHVHAGVQNGGSVTLPTSGGVGGSSNATGPDATPAQKKGKIKKTNVLATFKDTDMFERDTQDIETTVSRFMTYEPCPEHIDKGTEEE